MAPMAWPGRRVAVVGVDAQIDAVAGDGAHAAHHLDVAPGIDADLDFDRPDAFLDDLRHLLLGLLEIDEADGMGHGNGVARPAAQQGGHGDAELAAGQVVGGELDGGLGVGIAFDGPVHARV